MKSKIILKDSILGKIAYWNSEHRMFVVDRNRATTYKHEYLEQSQKYFDDLKELKKIWSERIEGIRI